MNYENILKKMTLEQKCVILSGADVFKTYAFESPEIPAIWLSDGPHGLRKQAGASDHHRLNPSEEATCFPTAAAAACSWDEALGEEIGEALGPGGSGTRCQCCAWSRTKYEAESALWQKF